MSCSRYPVEFGWRSATIRDFDVRRRGPTADTSGTITTVAGAGFRCGAPNQCLEFGDGGPATSAALFYPMGVVTDGDAGDAAENLFIADPGNSRIRKVSTSGIITTLTPETGF